MEDLILHLQERRNLLRMNNNEKKSQYEQVTGSLVTNCNPPF